MALALFLPDLAVTFRRLHDTGRSGWWIGGFWVGLIGAALLMGGIGISKQLSIFFGAISVAGIFSHFIALMVFFCQRGSPGPNHYG